MAKRSRVARRVLDPELELLVGTAGVAAPVFGLPTGETSRQAVAQFVQQVVCLHLVRSPGVASAVAAGLDGDGRGKDGEDSRELHIEVELRRI